jgi:hypothetical protein
MSGSAALLGAMVGAVAVAAGCEMVDLRPTPSDPGPLGEPFAVSNFFTPSGYMGDGERLGQLNADVQNDRCKQRPPGAVGDCYRFVYLPGAKQWAGVYWVFPANNWGSRAGRRVDGARFKQVRLQAASATPDLVVNFFVGRINDPTLPNRDRVSGSTGLRLGTAWTTIRIDIAGQQFERVIGALAWSLPYPTDWDGKQPVELYLDDIVWDTEPVPAEPGATP